MKQNLGVNMVIYNELIKEAEKHFSKESLQLIKKAYIVAEDLHCGQKRKSGEPYIIHPLYVAYIILTEIKFYDIKVIIAAILHDSIEDTGITKEYLAKLFSEEVADLVEGVTNVSDSRMGSKKAQDQYDIQKVLFRILKDFRIAIIKMADRLHNMRTLEYTKPEKQRNKAAETLSVYCPIALHLGANHINNELIDLSFKYLCASREEQILPASESNYETTKSLRSEYIENNQAKIENIEQELRELLRNNGLKGKVRGCAKSNFGIYQKLSEYRNISDIPNLISFEIETDSRDDCYKIAELIKRKYGTLEEYTKDYIAKPDPNGYQALHFSSKTCLESPCRFKVFSKSMGEVNKYGVVATYNHLLNPSIDTFQAKLRESNSFIRALDTNYNFSSNPFDYIEKTVRNLVKNTITVFDGTGKAHVLPNYSIVFDFVCDVTGGLSLDASGATVNGTLVNL